MVGLVGSHHRFSSCLLFVTPKQYLKKFSLNVGTRNYSWFGWTCFVAFVIRTYLFFVSPKQYLNKFSLAPAFSEVRLSVRKFLFLVRKNPFVLMCTGEIIHFSPLSPRFDSDLEAIIFVS